MEDQLAQEEEIAAIHSIYEEDNLFTYIPANHLGKFFVTINSPDTKAFNLNFEAEHLKIKVEHLPPILIDFAFPDKYPSVDPPKFTLSCRWLSVSNLANLCKKLDELWIENDNQCVLFTWISFLSSDIFEHLAIDIDNMKISGEENHAKNIDKRAIKRPCSYLLIKDYDKDQVVLKFQTSYFACKVCFVDKLGKDCTRFHECEHVFCNECMKGYFESQIASGDVNKLICPFDKCETQALQAQVLNLVGVELFNRYDGLLLKESLNMMSDIVYCPRVNCQSPVIPEDTLAQCNAIGCNYVFCALCRQGYHGIETCKITNVEMKRICVEYTTGDAEMQKFLHKKYGEKRIKLAIEETYSMDLIRNTSKQCPKCKSWMQKLDGCNKMACVRCHCYFCWLCFCILSKNDPYSHFNSKNSECFEKLFEGAWNLDNDEDDEENNRELLGEFGDLNLEDEGLDDLEDDDGIVFAR